MKIVIATAVYYPQVNGVAVFAYNLANGLARRGHEVAVICPSQTGDNYEAMVDGVKVYYLESVQAKMYPDQIHEVPERKKVLGVRLPRILYKHGFPVSIWPAREVQRILADFRPDVVHVQVSDPIGLSVASYARKNGIPVVTTEHNQPEVLTEPLKVPGLVKKPVDTMLAAYFVNRQSKSDFVTMPTEKAIENLIWSRGVEFTVPVAAVSNGVELSAFRPGKAPARIYREYDIPRNAPVVLYVGRIDPEKKVGLVIEAFSKMATFDSNKIDMLSNTLCDKNDEILARLSEAVLVIVGDGVDKNRLVKMSDDMGVSARVKFLGKVMPPDLYDLYRAGTIFATASEIETQGIVLIEAAATGLPLVAVDKGAVSEICIDGKNGFLCQPGDIDGIALAMARILADPELGGKFSKASIALAKEHDFERTLEKFENIYKKVIEQKKK